jgi:hypothetical protein
MLKLTLAVAMTDTHMPPAGEATFVFPGDKVIVGENKDHDAMNIDGDEKVAKLGPGKCLSGQAGCCIPLGMLTPVARRSPSGGRRYNCLEGWDALP